MKKRKKLFMLILTIILLLPIPVKADENRIDVDTVKCPVIGQKPTYIGNTISQYVDRLEERWVDVTEHKIMKSTDTFIAGHLYDYDFGYVLKSSYEDKYFAYPNMDNEECTYGFGGIGDIGQNNFTQSSRRFYMGNLDDYVYQDDSINLKISQPTLGSVAPTVQSDSKYTINSQKWYNLTENKEMTSIETFKSNTKYKLTVNYSSLYSVNDFNEIFGSNSYFLGTGYENGWLEHIGERQVSAYFYFGNRKDLEIDGSLVLSDNAPVAGQKIKEFNVTTNISGRMSQNWSVMERINSSTTSSRTITDPNAVFEAGKTYYYHVYLELEPGVYLKDGFKVTNNNKNGSFIEDYTYTSFEYGSYISYSATYTILENGKTFGIINQYSSIIYPNQMTPLKIYPEEKANDTYTWASSNEAVATVSDGWVYGEAPGKAIITATNDKEESASYEIEVGIPADKVTLNKTEVSLDVGDQVTLTAVVTPDNATDKSVMWYATEVDTDYYMNPIVNINNGNIIARRAGTVKIAASTPSGATAYCVITVTEPDPENVKPTGISLNKNAIDIEEGKTETLNATVAPNNATDKTVTWTSEDPSIATVDKDGKVTGVKVGETRVTAQTVNGKIAICVVRVTTNYAVTFYDGNEVISFKEYLSGIPANSIEKPFLITEDKVVVNWYTDPELTHEFDFSGTIDSDLNLYAKWEDINVSITTNVDSIDYGEVYTDFSDNVQRKIKVINNGNVPVLINVTTPTGSELFSSEELHEVVLDSGQERDVTLMVNAKGKNHDVPGEYSGTYKFQGVDVGNIDRRSNVEVNANLVIKKLPMHVSYTTHVQTYGWQKYVKDGQMAGTTGEKKRLEGIKIKLENQDYSGDIEYKTHIQKIGWEEKYKKNGEMSGTEGMAYRLEAIQIRLTGEMAEHYDVYYRVHAQKFGWLGWAKNDEPAGTAAYAYRLEGIEIKLVKKGETFPEYDETQIAFSDKNAVSQVTLNKTNISIEAGDEDELIASVDPDTAVDKTITWTSDNTDSVTVDQNGKITAVNSGTATVTATSSNGKKATCNVNVLPPIPGVKYTTHVQTYGWQKYVSNGTMAGTTGEKKRLEGIKIELKNMPYEGDIEYRTHIQKIGWEDDYKKNGEMSGTEGMAYRLEAIQIRLTGEIAEHYDIYYRVHAQKFGWLGWAKNGESAGTAAYAYRLEGIEIQLVEKGQMPTENEHQNDNDAFYENE